MYILIQSNIHKDPDFDRIYPILDELKIPYEKVELNSTIKKLEISQDRNDVFVYGSVKLAMLAKQNSNWIPGSYYGGNHLFENNSIFYKNNLLNYPSKVFKLIDDLEWNSNEEKFIKPYKFAKLFTGNIFTKNKWLNFVENILKEPNNPYVSENSLIQVSSPRDVIKEARIWIIGGEIVEAVYYKILKDIPYEDAVEEAGIEFTKEMIMLFEVAESYVMDICLTDLGWKIVEVNCINSAGFFPNVNVKKVFNSLNNYYNKKYGQS